LKRRERYVFAEVDGPDSTGDFLEPTWVHELIKKPEELKRLREDFEKWHRE